MHQRNLVPNSLNSFDEQITQSPLESFKTYFKKNKGLIEYLKKPGEKVEAGEPLYKVINLDDGLNSTIFINNLKKGVVINHSPSPSMPIGSEIYQVLELN